MTENEFYEDLLGISFLRVESVQKTAQAFHFHCIVTKTSSICPSCLQETTIIHQYDSRRVQDVTISGREVYLHLRVPQFLCPDCNRYFTHKLDWIVAGKSYTKRQSRFIFELCAKQPFTEVAKIVNLSHKTVERLYYEVAEQKLCLSERYAQVRHLGIDEVSHRKGKKDYVCVLTDLERGIQLDILASRTKEALLSHFRKLGQEFCQQIEVVCCDMWKTYLHVAEECFPNAEVVIDRFHVVAALNNVLDVKRRELRKSYRKEESFKNIKWALWKRPEDCSGKQAEQLQCAFRHAWLLEELYELRNTFNNLFDRADNPAMLQRELLHWMRHAKTLHNDALDAFIATLKRWMKPITAFASNRVTNALTEGLNNCLRYVKRVSFGIPKFEHMRLRVLSFSN